MFGLDPQTNPTYCGYCKCDPCQCDGHGNFGPVENVSWYPVSLDIPGTVEEVEEGPLTYKDGTLVPESHERHLRTDKRSPERAWRPQRPRY
jgi:hypothetical protein